VINDEQQPFLAKKMSTARLTRVQEAAKQVKANESGAAEAAAVLQLGHYYACAFEDDDDGPYVAFGRLEAMKEPKTKGSVLVRESMLLLDDAKRENKQLLFTWFMDATSPSTLFFGKHRSPHSIQLMVLLG
jgi:hypothetical protein